MRQLSQQRELFETRTIWPHQHDFLHRRSCPSNLLAFEEAVTHMMGEGHTVDVMYLDVAKATDSVNHRFLLAKMQFFGLGDAVVRWIEAYLTGRVSIIHVGGKLQCVVVFH